MPLNVFSTALGYSLERIASIECSLPQEFWVEFVEPHKEPYLLVLLRQRRQQIVIRIKPCRHAQIQPVWKCDLNRFAPWVQASGVVVEAEASIAGVEEDPSFGDASESTYVVAPLQSSFSNCVPDQ